jgi:hypothetical protein
MKKVEYRIGKIFVEKYCLLNCFVSSLYRMGIHSGSNAGKLWSGRESVSFMS